MAKNVMKLLKPSPSHGRNAFDLSRRDINALNFGELLPVFCCETMPNDKISVRPADLLRAQPLVTSPFLRSKQHIDFWFVPYSLLWSRWNDFLTSRSEPNSAALKNAAFLPTFNLKSFLDAVAASSQTDVFGSNANFKKNAYRLLDSLGYPTYDYYYNTGGTSSDYSVSVNPFRLAAYQKIWYCEYRQQYYDTGSLGFTSPAAGINDNYAQMFNFDDLNCDSVANSDILGRWSSQGSATGSPVDYLGQMRYRCWKKDLFTGLLPTSQLGAVSSIDAIGGRLPIYPVTDNIWSTSDGNVHGLVGASGSIALGNSTGQTQIATLAQSTSFDVLALRKSEAIQIWRENALRAGNQVEDNYRAHFGVAPKSHLETHPTFVGSYDAPINIGDVMATAQTGANTNGQVGDIAGKGISSIDGNEIHFQTSDFGILMGICSLLPETEYESCGIDRANQLVEQFDFPFPELDRIGLEAVDNKTLNIHRTGAAGYAPRNFGWKTVVDKCHLDFFKYRQNAQGQMVYQGVFQQWCSPRPLSYTGTGAALKGLYVDPLTFTQNFNMGANLVPQFLLDAYFDCTVLRELSVSGLPTS